MPPRAPRSSAAPVSGANPTGAGKRDLGAFYTPAHTVDWMLSLVPVGPETTCLEPSGGDGAFVRGLITRGATPGRIDVWDINEGVRETIESLGAHVTIQDTLLRADFRTPVQRYGLVAGNPPYLSKSSAYIKAHRADLKRRFPEVTASEAYGMFLFAGVHLLEDHGHLVFIISDSYRTLAIHERLRRWLLAHTTIHQIAIMPRTLFADTGTHVQTSVIHVERRPASPGHGILFNDCSAKAPGDYGGVTRRVSQEAVAQGAGAAFLATEDAITDRAVGMGDKLLDHLHGGLGMHTADNARFLARITYDGETLPPSNRVPNTVDYQEVLDRPDRWRIYHKSGGVNPYYTQPRHAIRWDAESRATYMGPKSFWDHEARRSAPVLISGVCSELSARLGVPGGAWNSNKCFGFHPKRPGTYPASFFIAILNSRPYREMLRRLNHTASIQVRNLAQLPMLPFSEADVRMLADLGQQAIAARKRGLEASPVIVERIDAIVRACLP